MTKDDAFIEVTVQHNALGMIEKKNFTWKGNSPYVRIDFRSLVLDSIYHNDDYSRVQIGPFKLRKMPQDSEFYWPLYVRDDRLGALRVWFYTTTRWLDLIYRRCIITLVVWRLADFKDGVIPSWKDIKIFHK